MVIQSKQSRTETPRIPPKGLTQAARTLPGLQVLERPILSDLHSSFLREILSLCMLSLKAGLADA